MIDTTEYDAAQKTLIGMVGLPYSGKTTAAQTMGLPIVCPDAIRLALHGKRFIGTAESMVWAIAESMVQALFLAGHDFVVLNACSQSQHRRDEWERPKLWHTTWMVCAASADECKARALAAGDDHILPIIERMSESFTLPASWTPA